MNAKETLYQSQVERRKEKDSNAKRIATRGEEIAAEFLEKASYIVLETNFRAGREGEIDIVAVSPEGVLVFAEVKTRTVDGIQYGIPELGFEAVSYSKQKKILAVSNAYMQKCGRGRMRWRYDVIVIYICREPGEPLQIFHVEDAFC